MLPQLALVVLCIRTPDVLLSGVSVLYTFLFFSYYQHEE